ncbi:DUF3433 domain-containing protein [Aspergillus homomorphus CBS 101889]|uniref:Uncharacterized protein n=1 Tax=Aspergillus homomorphus (strain CBS 101889) TaxID=1450537 RepID=A0A395HZR3_ASPHC|nr:hypothetical protein BO97DRAFT_451566 [Aspergillus homomorphus CBS 101889]RAL12368.1 hypothetical protein BO97DRAFT_451566 [Aspergillus homomorphus CBS 101889]
MRCIRRQLSAGHATNDEARGNWLPPTLRRPYLLTLSTLLLLMAVAVEVLRQYSNLHNGVAQFKNQENLSPREWRAWTDTPTIVGLVAVVLWEVFAQDVLRLEPYFQLAGSSEVPASVLFINYSFDAGILAPIRAARNRHWIVLCVSAMSMAIHLAVPSLLSGLLTLASTDIVETKALHTWPHLVGMEIQENWFSIEAAHRNFSQEPRGNPLGLKSNVKYALAPLSNVAYESDAYALMNLNQSVYWSDMTCVNATVAGTMPHAPNATATNEHRLSWDLSNITFPDIGSTSDCNIDIMLDSIFPLGDGKFQARHWAPVQSAPASFSQSAFRATKCISTGFLGVMVEVESRAGTILNSNAIAFACQPIFRQSIASVSFTRGVFDSASIVLNIPTVSKLSTKEFSVHGFQGLMSSDLTATELPLDQKFRVVVSGDTETLQLTQYQDTIGHLWNSEFVVAIDRLFDRQANAVRVDAKFSMSLLTIAVTPRTAVAVEVITILGSLLVLYLSFAYPRRPRLLHRDPSSIAAQCHLIARLIGPDTLNTLSHPNYHVAKTRELRKWTKGLWCRWTTGSVDQVIEISSIDGSPAKMCARPAVSARRDPMPHFLTLPWFVMECVLLVGAVTLFGLTYTWIQIHAIDSLSSTRFLVAAVFLVYGPTVLASIMRSLLNSLHRHLSVAEPWIQLRNGMVTSKKLSAPIYGPLSSLFLSMRRGPRPPVAVLTLSLICMLNLILVVVSGGLFEPQINTYLAASGLTTAYTESSFVGHTLDPGFRIYDRSIFPLTTNESNIPWVTSHLSFLPFTIDMVEDAVGVLYTTTRRGIGANLKCEAVSPANAIADYSTGTMNWTYAPVDNSTLECTLQLPLNVSEPQRTTIQWAWPDSSDCQRLNFFVSSSIPTKGNSITTAMYCTPHLTNPTYEIQVDPSSLIQEHTLIANESPLTTGSFFESLSTALGTFNQNLGTFIHNITTHPHPLPYYLSSFPNAQTTDFYQQHRQDDHKISTQDLAHAVQSIYQSTFLNYMTLHRDELFPPGPLVQIPGKTTYTLWGLMPSTTSILIIIVILSLDVLALVTVFLCYFGRYDAPRIPKAVGSLIPWVGGREGLRRLKDMDEQDNTKRQYHFWPRTDADDQTTCNLPIP